MGNLCFIGYCFLYKFHKLKQIKYTNIGIFKKLYETCVVPIMDYNCSVWGNYQNKRGKNIQLSAQRYFLGVHNKAPIDGISGDILLCVNCGTD